MQPSLSIEDYPAGCLRIYDGGHRIAAARQVLADFGEDLPVTLAVRMVGESEGSIIDRETHALNQRVLMPEMFMLPDARPEVKYAACRQSSSCLWASLRARGSRCLHDAHAPCSCSWHCSCMHALHASEMLR